MATWKRGVVGALLVPLVLAAEARAGDPPPQGLAVVALDGSSDVAWPLAEDIYGRAPLRPPSLDEARARVLAGEPLPLGASRTLTELAETRAAVHGDDAPSRQLLSSIARTLHARAIVVVDSEPVNGPLVTMGSADGGAPAPRWRPYARVFVAELGAFDAARYFADSSVAEEDRAILTWNDAVQSLDRVYGAPPTFLVPPPLKPEAPQESSSRPFYTSPWFWGALGAAAFGAGAIYFATRDTSNGMIHLQLQVPK